MIYDFLLMLRVVREADCFNSHSGIRLALSIILFQIEFVKKVFSVKKLQVPTVRGCYSIWCAYGCESPITWIVMQIPFGAMNIFCLFLCSPLHQEKYCKCQRPLAKDSCSVSKGSLILELILVFNSSEGLVCYSWREIGRSSTTDE
jgi:hypothetical protein